MHTWHDIWAERALTSRTCLWSKQHMHHVHGQWVSRHTVSGTVTVQGAWSSQQWHSHHSSRSVVTASEQRSSGHSRRHRVAAQFWFFTGRRFRPGFLAPGDQNQAFWFFGMRAVFWVS